MSINRMYDIWYPQILQLLPRERITRVRNFTWLVVGIFLSKSVQLSKIGLKIPGRAREVSVVRRLSRFLSNPGFVTRTIYEPIVRSWLQSLAAVQDSLLLIIDGTRVGFGYHLLIVAAAYRRRALPIAWCWVRAKKGHSPLETQLELLAYTRTLLPENTSVKLVGDSEFRAGELWKQLEAWGWDYVLRLIETYQVRSTPNEPWQPIGDLVSQPGQKVWQEQVYLTMKHEHRANVLAYWQIGEKWPWLLATNLTTPEMTLKAYRRRMWVEEMFGDWKRHGFDFQSTHVRHPERLSILTLAIVLLYSWLVFRGVHIIKNGERTWVDRADRRDLCVFQIGLRWVERCLTNQIKFSVSFLIPRWKLSGS
jgi:hypothetical protein